jgi:release factor glutamine methyltransferase
MDIRTALKQGIARLRAAHVPSHTLAAELLLLHVLQRDRTWLYAHAEEPLLESQAHRFLHFIERRAAGEPVQHLTGKQEFWGLQFEVSPDVLIPRPETEHLVEVALDRLALRELRAGRSNKSGGAGLLIADIGTGSGCIAIALATELPHAQFIASDISPEALAVAKRNAARHNVSSRIRFLHCSLLEGAASAAPQVPDSPIVARQARVVRQQSLSLDLIASNPPYIGRREADTLAPEVRRHEPELALFGGEEGYEFYAGLIAEAAHYLKSGGLLVLELGHNSLPAVRPLLDERLWTNIAVTQDLAGIDRVLAAERI